MHFVVKSRAMGKTTDVVDWFMNRPHSRAIVVFSERERVHVVRLIRDRCSFQDNKQFFDSIKVNVVRWGALQELRGRDIKEVFIDNMDLILRDMFHGADIHMTSTEEVVVMH